MSKNPNKKSVNLNKTDLGCTQIAIGKTRQLFGISTTNEPFIFYLKSNMLHDILIKNLTLCFERTEIYIAR